MAIRDGSGQARPARHIPPVGEAHGVPILGDTWCVKRLQTGWELLRGCFAMVRAVPVLLLPGLVHVVATFAFVGAFLYVVRGDDRLRLDTLLLLYGVLVAMSVVGTLAAAVVVAVTTEHMNGRPTGVGDGVRLVVPHLPALLVWSLLNATVGAALRAIEERLGTFGRWVTWGVASLFALATLLVVPVVLFEGGSTRRALRRSAALFRERWGEATVSRGGIEVILTVGLLVAVVLVVCPLTLVGTTPAIAAAVMLATVHFALSSTATAILSAALYRYAVNGEGGPFGDLSRLFVPELVKLSV